MLPISAAEEALFLDPLCSKCFDPFKTMLAFVLFFLGELPLLGLYLKIIGGFWELSFRICEYGIHSQLFSCPRIKFLKSLSYEGGPP